MQDIYYGIRDKTRVMADHHANLGRTVDGSIVQHLQKLKLEIKAHIKVSAFIVNQTSRLMNTCLYNSMYRVTRENWPPVLQKSGNSLPK